MKARLSSIANFLLLGAIAGSAQHSPDNSAQSTQSDRIGWPANYEGVMLQGFYWDSFEDSSWVNLQAQSDEISEYFDLMWIPNSAYSGMSPQMGYHPVYWFSNHNSDFGTEEELLNMIQTFKQKGTGIIADVVVNHRKGLTNYYDFPEEEWNGKKWHIGLDGICSDDEMKDMEGMPTPTGSTDTGIHWDLACDLDHTNANVQENIKAYTQCLKEKYGYTGFRYDLVHGFGAQYIGMYNEASQAEFSVGENWNQFYNDVTRWIRETGYRSAAFDFPGKYAMNRAFWQGGYYLENLTEYASDGSKQPNGIIREEYKRYAVTFVDNHDSYREDWNMFTGNIIAANAYILSSPGTPCVFLCHWMQYKDEIKRLIKARKLAGINNMSNVKVIKTAGDCYMAQMTGSKGYLTVRIGTSTDIPDGYSDSDIRAKGNGYCVWVKLDGDIPPVDPVYPPIDPDEGTETIYAVGECDELNWSPEQPLEIHKENDSFSVTLSNLSRLKVSTTRSYTSGDWDSFNKGAVTCPNITSDQLGQTIPLSTGTEDIVMPAKATYTLTFNGDLTEMVAELISDAEYTPVYIRGNMNGWGIPDDWRMTTSDGKTYWFDCDSSHQIPQGTEWKISEDNWEGDINYSAATTILPSTEAQLWNYHDANTTMGTTYSGTIKLILPDTPRQKAEVTVYPTIVAHGTTGIADITTYNQSDDAAEYYNLQGIKVKHPSNGIFLKKQGCKITKVSLICNSQDLF